MTLSNNYKKMCMAEKIPFCFPTIDIQFDTYKKTRGIKFESLVMLEFANWFVDKVKEDHSFCLKYKTKDEVVMLWIMEECYGKTWDGDTFQCQL